MIYYPNGMREKVADVKVVLFKRLYGVKPDTFHKMLLILQKDFNALHKNRGKSPKLTLEDKLYIALKYLREYRTMDGIAEDMRRIMDVRIGISEISATQIMNDLKNLSN
jgi:hypothetical protein